MVDGAEHKEVATKNVTVAGSPIVIVAVPESGKLIPNIENRIYFVTTYSSGKPVKTSFTVTAGDSKAVELKTDDGGFASMTMNPGKDPVTLKVAGSDAKGNKFSQDVKLDVNVQGADSLLLRTSKALYTVGDDAGLSVISTRKRGTVYFDVILNNQTVLTDMADLEDGKASAQLDLNESLAGSVAIRAYIISADGNIIRDTRLIYVDPANDLKIQITSDKQTFLPADYANIKFQSHRQGQSSWSFPPLG